VIICVFWCLLSDVTFRVSTSNSKTPTCSSHVDAAGYLVHDHVIGISMNWPRNVNGYVGRVMEHCPLHAWWGPVWRPRHRRLRQTTSQHLCPSISCFSCRKKNRKKIEITDGKIYSPSGKFAERAKQVSFKIWQKATSPPLVVASWWMHSSAACTGCELPTYFIRQ